MLDQAHNLVHALNDITPLGLCAGLGYIIYQLVSKNGWAHQLTDNHLSDLPTVTTTMGKLVASLERIEDSLAVIRDDLNYLKGRINGKS